MHLSSLSIRYAPSITTSQYAVMGLWSCLEQGWRCNSKILSITLVSNADAECGRLARICLRRIEWVKSIRPRPRLSVNASQNQLGFRTQMQDGGPMGNRSLLTSSNVCVDTASAGQPHLLQSTPCQQGFTISKASLTNFSLYCTMSLSSLLYTRRRK